MTDSQPTSDAIEILYRRYVKDDPETLSDLEKIQAYDYLERKIHYILFKSLVEERK